MSRLPRHTVTHNLHTNMTTPLGLNIKSQLGSTSTLLNASEATNIRYYVSDDMSDEVLE